MTRQEIEGYIIDKLKEIKEEYLKYNPEGEYLSMSVTYDEEGNGNDNGDWSCWHFAVNNAHYDEGAPDAEKPVDAWGYEDIKDERYYECNPEESDAV